MQNHWERTHHDLYHNCVINECFCCEKSGNLYLSLIWDSLQEDSSSSVTLLLLRKMKQSEVNCYHSGTFLHPAKWSNDFSIKRCLSYQSLIFSEFPAYFLLRYTILRYYLELFLQQKKSLDHKCHNCIHHYLPRAHDPHKSFTRQLHHHYDYA